MYHTPQGYKVAARSIPMTQMQKIRQRATWWAFVKGRNALNKRFATWGDVQQLLRDYRQPSLAEGREMLAEVKRPKENIRERMRQHTASRPPYAPAYTSPRARESDSIDSLGTNQWYTQNLQNKLGQQLKN